MKSYFLGGGGREGLGGTGLAVGGSEDCLEPEGACWSAAPLTDKFGLLPEAVGWVLGREGRGGTGRGGRGTGGLREGETFPFLGSYGGGGPVRGRFSPEGAGKVESGRGFESSCAASVFFSGGAGRVGLGGRVGR